MKIKIIDLLNIISKGEKLPKKVMSRGVEWKLEEGTNHYYYLNNCGNNRFTQDDLFEDLYELHGLRFLNNEVEIEEAKEIPKKIGVINYVEGQATALIHHKVDEIIDYLQSKEDE